MRTVRRFGCARRINSLTRGKNTLQAFGGDLVESRQISLSTSSEVWSTRGTPSELQTGAMAVHGFSPRNTCKAPPVRSSKKCGPGEPCVWVAQSTLDRCHRHTRGHDSTSAKFPSCSRRSRTSCPTVRLEPVLDLHAGVVSSSLRASRLYTTRFPSSCTHSANRPAVSRPPQGLSADTTRSSPARRHGLVSSTARTLTSEACSNSFS
mmetsp:Transcript_78458/g.153501  ORF Transcript_78458/g.153501 Transcript_78458/m.153501 type:complete len:207 (-) Transcript_78458:486-1106(-)